MFIRCVLVSTSLFFVTTQSLHALEYGQTKQQFQNSNLNERLSAQRTLTKLGFYKSSIDGLYGRGTHSAIEQFVARLSIPEAKFSLEDILNFEYENDFAYSLELGSGELVGEFDAFSATGDAAEISIGPMQDLNGDGFLDIPVETFRWNHDFDPSKPTIDGFERTTKPVFMFYNSENEKFEVNFDIQSQIEATSRWISEIATADINMDGTVEIFLADTGPDQLQCGHTDRLMNITAGSVVEHPNTPNLSMYSHELVTGNFDQFDGLEFLVLPMKSIWTNKEICTYIDHPMSDKPYLVFVNDDGEFDYRFIEFFDKSNKNIRRTSGDIATALAYDFDGDGMSEILGVGEVKYSGSIILYDQKNGYDFNEISRIDLGLNTDIQNERIVSNDILVLADEDDYADVMLVMARWGLSGYSGTFYKVVRIGSNLKLPIEDVTDVYFDFQNIASQFLSGVSDDESCFEASIEYFENVDQTVLVCSFAKGDEDFFPQKSYSPRVWLKNDNGFFTPVKINSESIADAYYFMPFKSKGEEYILATKEVKLGPVNWGYQIWRYPVLDIQKNQD